MTTYLISGRLEMETDATLVEICRVTGDTEYHKNLAWQIKSALERHGEQHGPGWRDVRVTALNP